MREVDFIARLQELLASPVSRLDSAAKAEIVLAAAERDLLSADDPYTFGHLFARLVCVELRVTEDGAPLAATN